MNYFNTSVLGLSLVVLALLAIMYIMAAVTRKCARKNTKVDEEQAPLMKQTPAQELSYSVPVPSTAAMSAQATDSLVEPSLSTQDTSYIPFAALGIPEPAESADQDQSAQFNGRTSSTAMCQLAATKTSINRATHERQSSFVTPPRVDQALVQAHDSEDSTCSPNKVDLNKTAHVDVAPASPELVTATPLSDPFESTIPHLSLDTTIHDTYHLGTRTPILPGNTRTLIKQYEKLSSSADIQADMYARGRTGVHRPKTAGTIRWNILEQRVFQASSELPPDSPVSLTWSASSSEEEGNDPLTPSTYKTWWETALPTSQSANDSNKASQGGLSSHLLRCTTRENSLSSASSTIR